MNEPDKTERTCDGRGNRKTLPHGNGGGGAQPLADHLVATAGQKEVEGVTGYRLAWIRTIARRCNAEGPGGIGDRRHHNLARRGALSAQEHERLKRLVVQGQDRGENWNGQRAAAWISQQLGRHLYVQRGCAWPVRAPAN